MLLTKTPLLLIKKPVPEAAAKRVSSPTSLKISSSPFFSVGNSLGSWFLSLAYSFKSLWIPFWRPEILREDIISFKIISFSLTSEISTWTQTANQQPKPFWWKMKFFYRHFWGFRCGREPGDGLVSTPQRPWEPFVV